MSGNFVQRGEPAILDKFTRARHAILSGADMVVELPENDNIELEQSLILTKGLVEVIDTQTGVVLLDNSDFVHVDAIASELEDLSGVQVYMNIQLNEEGTKILKKMSNMAQLKEYLLRYKVSPLGHTGLAVVVAAGRSQAENLLKAQGYYQTLMVGSDAEFGGRKPYFEQHGADKIYDILTECKHVFTVDSIITVAVTYLIRRRGQRVFGIFRKFKTVVGIVLPDYINKYLTCCLMLSNCRMSVTT